MHAIPDDTLIHLPGTNGDAYDCSHHVAVRLSFVVEYGCYGGVLDLADEACRSAIAELVSDRIHAAGGVEPYDLSRLDVLDTCGEGTDPVTDPSVRASYEDGAIAWTEHDDAPIETHADPLAPLVAPLLDLDFASRVEVAHRLGLEINCCASCGCFVGSRACHEDFEAVAREYDPCPCPQRGDGDDE